MKTKTINIYSFAELSDTAKEKVREYARNNWPNIGEHYIDDMISSLKALKEAIGGTLDYSLSIVLDRGEHCSLTGYDAEKLAELVKTAEKCPLTGVCYDMDVIEGLAARELESRVLNTLHAEGDYAYSDEGLDAMFEANEYEFLEDGSLA